MPNLSSSDGDQKYEIDSHALSNVLWCMNKKLEDFDKKFANVFSKIEYLEVYHKTLITEQFANFEKRLNLPTDNCERFRKANYDSLLGKIGESQLRL